MLFGMGTFQVYFPWPPSGLFGPGNCTLQVIWDGHNTQGYFSGHPPGYLGLAILLLPSRLFGLYTLRVVPSGLFGLGTLSPSGLFWPSYCALGMTTLRVIWGLTTLWANAPSRLFGPGYPLAWLGYCFCRIGLFWDQQLQRPNRSSPIFLWLTIDLSFFGRNTKLANSYQI